MQKFLFGQNDIEHKSLGVLEDNSLFTGAALLDEDVALILAIENLIA